MAKPKARNSANEVAVNGAGHSPTIAKPAVKHPDYTSEGVIDHDVFLLPGSDYQLMIGLVLVAAVVRLFRIYQPSSVVFDEVQYVVSAALLLAQC